MTWPLFVRCAAVLAAAGLTLSAAGAVDRYAFVIGIDAYQNITPLKTAGNDARAVADTLSAHGFRTFTAFDPDRRAFSLKLAELVRSVQPGDDVVVFFAGHGVAEAGTNYLLAADFPKLQPGQGGLLRDEAFSASEVIDRIKAAGARTTIAILDACRNNPLATGAGRSIGSVRGLSRMEPSQGSFVLFSADSGQEALDRLPTDKAKTNSVFTRFLLPYLKEGTLTFPEIARAVRRSVHDAARSADHQQLPAYYDALLEDFRLATATAAVEIEQRQPVEEPAGEALALLVGINNYANTPNDLKSAVPDILDIDKALASRGIKRMVLTDGAATNSAVRDALSSIDDRVGAGDTFIFVFSGHGSKIDDTGKVWRFFLADDIGESGAAASGAPLTTADLAETANRLTANGVKVVLVVDAISALDPILSLLPPDTTALFAQNDGDPYSDATVDGAARGALSWSVARAFEGKADANSDGALSQEELIAFVRDSVTELTDGKQSPGVWPATPTTTVLLAR